MITVADYWQGRDAEWPLQLDVQTRRNAAITIDLVNRLLVIAKTAGVPLSANAGGTLVNSGWRPPKVNAATPGASPTSLHMTAQAIDLYDPAGHLDAWLLACPQPLIDLGLWQEHPDATPRWCHVQTRPQRSFAQTGLRVFHP